ncbi:MAG TPA: carboxypeptidase regulatory-like domain-containing protein, partial [Planctomycetes bacterium]|nr:carboxypeptidase regulatory-like domain-containing protein [Planctomycetota bacterium]
MLKANEEHDLGEVLLEPGSTLRGMVRDADGNVVSGAMVLLGQETDFDLFAPSVRSDEDGIFTIRGVTSWSNDLVVRSPGFAANTISLQLPGDVLSGKPLAITLERGATI